MNHLRKNAIQGRRKDASPPNYGADKHGYGDKISTAWWFKVRNRWRRVYRSESNSFLCFYVIVGGKKRGLSGNLDGKNGDTK